MGVADRADGPQVWVNPMKVPVLIVACLCLVGCAKPAPEQRAKTNDIQIKFSGNYCFTNLRGQKTWASFFQRNDVLKVSPRRRDMPVTRHKQTDDGLWKNLKGPDTYQNLGGTVLWKANDGSGNRIEMRKC